MFNDCWAELGIAPTKDEREIRRAYARKLKQFRPDEDPAGFQRLVEARDRALFLAETSDKREWQTQEADAPFVDELPAVVNTLPESATAEETATVVKPAPDDTRGKTDEREQIRRVYKRLGLLIVAATRNSDVSSRAWKAQSWSTLFDRAALLGFDEHRAFHETIARRLGEFLPDPDVDTIDITSFEAGFGPCAVVEQIEKECEFSLLGTRLIQIVDPQAVDRYFAWLNLAQKARALIERRQHPDTAYINPQNDFLLFPQEDKVVLLHDDDLQKYFQKSEERGYFPFQFDLSSLFIPASRLFGICDNKTGLAMTAFAWVIYMVLYNIRVDWFAIAAACLSVFIGLRIYFSATYYSRAIKKYINRVMEADRQGILSFADRKQFFARACAAPAYTSYLSLLEVAATLAIIIPLISFITAWSNKDMLSQPAETVLAEQVINLFEVTARNDAVETSAFFNLFTTISEARSQMDIISTVEPVRLKELSDPLKIIHLVPKIEELSRQTTKILYPLTPLIARNRKLTALSKRYRNASPAERRQLEQALRELGTSLDSKSTLSTLSSRSETLLWEFTPPQQHDVLPLVPFEPEIRQLVLGYFLKQQLAAIAGFRKQNIAERAAELQLLLTIPDNTLLASIGSQVQPDNTQPNATPKLDDFNEYPNNSKGKTSIFGGIVGSIIRGSADALEVKNELSKVGFAVNLTRFDKSLPVWDEGVIGWAKFLNVAYICSNLVEPIDQEETQKALLTALHGAQRASRGSEPAYWDISARQMLNIASCRAQYAAFHNLSKIGGPTFGISSSLLEQMRVLIASNNTGEARQAALYAAATVDGIEGKNEDLRDFANSYLAYDRLKAGKPREALSYLDRMVSQSDACRENIALRGFILQALGEKQYALKELKAAKRATICLQFNSAVNFKYSEIEAAVETLEKETDALKTKILGKSEL